MQRLKHLMPLAVALAAFGLVRSGILDTAGAIWLVIGTELAMLLFGARAVWMAMRRYRRGRAEQLEARAALEDALTEFVPRPAARWLALEPVLWWSLVAWILRKPPGSGFAYAGHSVMLPLAILLTVVGPAEMLLIDVLIPDQVAWLRWILNLLALYAVLWVWGLAASQRMLPHQLEAVALRVRDGALLDVRVPYVAIAGASVSERRLPGRPEGLEVDATRRCAHIKVGGAVNIALALSTPLQIETMTGHTRPVDQLCFWTDAPQDLLEALRGKLGTPPISDAAGRT